MQLPQLEFSRAEHWAWEQERADMYLSLQQHQRPAGFLESIRQRHDDLACRAFVLTFAGVRTIPLPDSQSLVLARTRSSTRDGSAVSLSHWTTRTMDEGNVDIKSQTIAVFGERINLESDADPYGRDGIGGRAKKGSFLGICAVRRTPKRDARYTTPQRQIMYVPYAVELDQLDSLLGEFRK